VGGLRDFASSKGTIIPAGFFGKIKTAFQMTALTLLIYKNELLGINIFLVGKILIYLSVIISVYSGFVYYRNFFRQEVNA
jgi:CDP-diacylglycerol--glycerol-3-phosphate 3-phosphatidyltransferase/cardiolipin synthase